ncbi:putative dynamin central domain, Dynamin superfamily [Helianthus anomalus]
MFETSSLCKLDKSTVGGQSLAIKLLEIQSSVVLSCLPIIVKNIHGKVLYAVKELEKLPVISNNDVELTGSIMRMCGSLKEELKKILIDGELPEYEYDNVNFVAHMSDMINKFVEEVQSSHMFSKEGFLLEEIKAIKETHGLWQPDFLLSKAFSELA